jgi:hypothetical protein
VIKVSRRALLDRESSVPDNIRPLIAEPDAPQGAVLLSK